MALKSHFQKTKFQKITILVLICLKKRKEYSHTCKKGNDANNNKIVVTLKIEISLLSSITVIIISHQSLYVIECVNDLSYSLMKTKLRSVKKLYRAEWN